MRFFSSRTRYRGCDLKSLPFLTSNCNHVYNPYTFCNLKTDHISFFLSIILPRLFEPNRLPYIKFPLCLYQAFEFYNKALRCLADRKKSPEVWDTVTWELSGSYFSMGTLLQDFAPLSTYAQEQVTDLYDGTSQASVDAEKVRNPV